MSLFGGASASRPRKRTSQLLAIITKGLPPTPDRQSDTPAGAAAAVCVKRRQPNVGFVLWVTSSSDTPNCLTEADELPFNREG